MELRQLRIVVMLAEELHYGRTAARLGIAQSAVTQAVQALEAELAVTLFERTRRHVALSSREMLKRMGSRDCDQQMPPLATERVDTQAVALFRTWLQRF